jgi:hypothetical protein
MLPGSAAAGWGPAGGAWLLLSSNSPVKHMLLLQLLLLLCAWLLLVVQLGLLLAALPSTTCWIARCKPCLQRLLDLRLLQLLACRTQCPDHAVLPLRLCIALAL